MKVSTAMGVVTMRIIRGRRQSQIWSKWTKNVQINQIWLSLKCTGYEQWMSGSICEFIQCDNFTNAEHKLQLDFNKVWFSDTKFRCNCVLFGWGKCGGAMEMENKLWIMIQLSVTKLCKFTKLLHQISIIFLNKLILW